MCTELGLKTYGSKMIIIDHINKFKLQPQNITTMAPQPEIQSIDRVSVKTEYSDNEYSDISYLVILFWKLVWF